MRLQTPEIRVQIGQVREFDALGPFIFRRGPWQSVGHLYNTRTASDTARVLKRPTLLGIYTSQPIHSDASLKINMTATHSTARSIYRRFLRELPSPSATNPTLSNMNKATILSHPSPLQKRIRSQLNTDTAATSESQLQAADQMLQYLRAQRVYTTLIERYNPGMNMDEESRTRLTARRVGMELPVEFEVKPFGDGKS